MNGFATAVAWNLDGGGDESSVVWLWSPTDFDFGPPVRWCHTNATSTRIGWFHENHFNFLSKK